MQGEFRRYRIPTPGRYASNCRGCPSSRAAFSRVETLHPHGADQLVYAIGFSPVVAGPAEMPGQAAYVRAAKRSRASKSCCRTDDGR